jgi:hypothetical protein
LIPAIPHIAAGIRIEPPVSVPSAAFTIPDATAAAEPPLEPPGIRSSAAGFFVGGVVVLHANSAVRVLPTTIAPDDRSLATAVESELGMYSGNAGDP